MNRELRKTAIFAGTALVLVLLAWVTKASPQPPQIFEPQGQEFFPDFKDPLKVAALEVVDHDPTTNTYKPFRVQVVNGLWSIPSHENYPADGKERLKNTATSVMDLRKERVASDEPKMHEEFGVVDPLDGNVQGTKGRGKRVKLFDASNTVLADFIFGNEVKDGGGRCYVRVPGQKHTYVIKSKPDISVKFEDWVETDLLQMGSAAVTRVIIDKYSFDEEKGKRENWSTHSLALDDAKVWKISGQTDKEDANTENITAMISTMTGLKLAGVRAKPPAVAKAKNLDEIGKMPRQQLIQVAQSMMRHGFFIMQDGARFIVVSNEGEMNVSCDDGVVYTLRFGEVLVGSGEEITSGAADPKKDKKDEKKDEKKGGTENRYLFVGVRFDDTLLPAPVEPKAYVADPAKKPEEQKAEEDKAKKDKEEYETKKKDWEKKKEDGKKRADKLALRFADWYYVISADAFKKLRLDRTALVKPKEAKPDEKKPGEHKEGDGHKHDEKKPEPPKKPEDKPKAPEDKKPEDKKPEEKKPEEKKP